MTPLAYPRFPGMGDLPGDSSHPNSPDYVPHEPEDWQVQDAINAVEARMQREFTASEFLADLHANGMALHALDALLSNTPAKSLPYGHADALNGLLKVLRTLDANIDAELEVLS